MQSLLWHDWSMSILMSYCLLLIQRQRFRVSSQVQALHEYNYQSTSPFNRSAPPSPFAEMHGNHAAASYAPSLPTAACVLSVNNKHHCSDGENNGFGLYNKAF